MKTKRVGPKMAQVRFLCSDRPRARIDLAAIVGPNRSLKFGYEIVNRAIKAGVVRVVDTIPGRRGFCVQAV